MGWIGVDFDGTLSRLKGTSIDSTGEPIPEMVERVKRWLAQGKEVRIVTARVGCTGLVATEASGLRDDAVFADAQRKLIEDWCEKHIGQRLRVTAQKDYAMLELWDDRAVQVECDTGKVIGRSTRGLD
jgi:hypothetical protein